jgi:hypothetical protein
MKSRSVVGRVRRNTKEADDRYEAESRRQVPRISPRLSEVQYRHVVAARGPGESLAHALLRVGPELLALAEGAGR